jgi:hypothetical protein
MAAIRQRRIVALIVTSAAGTVVFLSAHAAGRPARAERQFRQTHAEDFKLCGKPRRLTQNPA